MKKFFSKLSLVLVAALILGLFTFTASADEKKITRAFDKTTGAVIYLPESIELIEGVNYPAGAIISNGTIFADWFFYSTGMPEENYWNQTPLWIGQTVNIGVKYHYQYPGQAQEAVFPVTYRWFAQNDVLWVTARPIPNVDQIIGIPLGYTAKWVNKQGKPMTVIANDNWHINLWTFDNLLYPYYEVDCYALFTPNEVGKMAKLVYNGINEVEYYIVGDDVTVRESVEKPGKIFEGWTDGEHLYQPGEEFTIEGDKELTPVYSDDPKGIRYITYTDGVGGKAFQDQSYATVRKGDVPKFSGNPEYKNHLFKGWKYINLDTGFDVHEEDLKALMGEANIKAVAQWVDTGSTGEANYVLYIAAMVLVGASAFVIFRARRQK